MAKQAENKKKISEILYEVNASLDTMETVKNDPPVIEEVHAEAEDTAEEKPASAYINTQIVLVLRVIVAGYLLYTSYSLVTGYIKGSSIPLWGLLLSVSVFTVFAIVVGGLAIKALIKGEYVGGKADNLK